MNELQQLQQDFQQLLQRVQRIEGLLQTLIASDRYVFGKTIQLQDGRNIQLATGTGTKIGTATGQKIAFHNATPSIQQSKINDPSGGGTVDSEARTAINSIIDVLENKGFTAS